MFRVVDMKPAVEALAPSQGFAASFSMRAASLLWPKARPYLAEQF